MSIMDHSSYCTQSSVYDMFSILIFAYVATPSSNHSEICILLESRGKLQEINASLASHGGLILFSSQPWFMSIALNLPLHWSEFAFNCNNPLLHMQL